MLSSSEPVSDLSPRMAASSRGDGPSEVVDMSLSVDKMLSVVSWCFIGGGPWGSSGVSSGVDARDGDRASAATPESTALQGSMVGFGGGVQEGGRAVTGVTRSYRSPQHTRQSDEQNVLGYPIER